MPYIIQINLKDLTQRFRVFSMYVSFFNHTCISIIFSIWLARNFCAVSLNKVGKQVSISWRFSSPTRNMNNILNFAIVFGFILPFHQCDLMVWKFGHGIWPARNDILLFYLFRFICHRTDMSSLECTGTLMATIEYSSPFCRIISRGMAMMQFWITLVNVLKIWAEMKHWTLHALLSTHITESRGMVCSKVALLYCCQ